MLRSPSAGFGGSPTSSGRLRSRSCWPLPSSTCQMPRSSSISIFSRPASIFRSKVSMTTPAANGHENGSSANRVARIHVFAILAVALAILCGFGAVNWIFDPFNHLRTEVDVARKDARSAGDWTLKVALAARAPYDAILIGSSKMGYVDPAQLHYYHFFDAGVGQASVEAIRDFLDVSTRSKGRIKLVVLGIDFFMLNAHWPPAPTLA